MNGTTVRQQAVSAVASYKLKTKDNGKKPQRLEDIYGSEVFGLDSEYLAEEITELADLLRYLHASCNQPKQAFQFCDISSSHALYTIRPQSSTLVLPSALDAAVFFFSLPYYCLDIAIRQSHLPQCFRATRHVQLR